MKKNRFNIAVIAGDGIGKEVMPEGIKVLKKVSEKFDINLNFEEFDFSSYDYYEKHGQMMPDNWKEKISNHDAIFFGAVGWPDKIPDHVSLWGSLLKFRREFDQYVNLRPVKLMPGVKIQAILISTLLEKILKENIHPLVEKCSLTLKENLLSKKL